MAKTERLGVWLHGRKLADLERRHWNELRCRYTNEALELWPRNTPLLSCSLPLGAGRLDAMNYCRGLLPEGRALQALAAEAGVAVTDVFGLLRRFGRDVAGALVIAEDPPEPGREGLAPYSAASLAEAVEMGDEYPLGVHDDSELSLAGLQDKLLLVEVDSGPGESGWARPIRGRPSTHILKVDDPRHEGLVEAEGHCLALARTAGLTTVETRIERIAERTCLIVSRFDRDLTPKGLQRIHQEDICQALGLDPARARGRAKYERAGGPGFGQVAALLDSFAADSEAELDRLVAAMTFTVLIGNADGHGKNLALLHDESGNVALAPLYDTVPTMLWPKLRAEAAMSVAGKTSLTQITLEDLADEAASWPHSRQRAFDVARKTIDSLSQSLDDGVLPEDSPVADLVQSQARRLSA